MQEGQIMINRTARYYILSDNSLPIREVWIVLHGYGQLAQDFIKTFESVLKPGVCIVAPEALSRFYISHHKKTIGASWMTSEFREAEIADYSNYLTQVYHEVCRTRMIGVHKLILMGFSQGVATLFRWLTTSNISVNHIIAWAGSIPSELAEKESFIERMKIDSYVIYGQQDGIVTAEEQATSIAFIEKHHLPYRIIFFGGRHQVDEKTLNSLVNQIRNE